MDVTGVQERYNNLREQILSAVPRDIDKSALTEFKNQYSDEIRSQRKLDSIKDVARFIQILETRDIINTHNIDPYYYIAKRILNDSSITMLLKEYENWLGTIQRPQLCNVYMNEHVTMPRVMQGSTNHIFDRINSTSSSLRNASITSVQPEIYSNRVFSRNDNNPVKEEVIRCIGSRLGQSWRDVARFLNIKQYQIDEIQNKHPFNLKEQCYEALHLCLSQYNEDKWKIYLMQALEKSRRRDLKELVEQIILTGERNM